MFQLPYAIVVYVPFNVQGLGSYCILEGGITNYNNNYLLVNAKI